MENKSEIKNRQECENAKYWKNKTAAWIVDSRWALQLKQKDLAALLGVSPSSLSNYEAKKTVPPGHLILWIQNLLLEAGK